MKNRSIVFFLCSIFILCGALEVNAQTQKRKYRTKAFRRKEKRITSYTGGRTGGFAKASAYSSIGISVNAFNYFGDLAPDPSRLSTDVSFTRPGFGLVYAKRIGARYQLRGTLTYGRVRGSDESNDASGEDIFRFRRNLDFRNSIIELGATAQVYLFENHGSSASRPLFNPYIYAGIGIIRHNPQGQVPDFNRDGSQRAEIGRAHV